MRKVLFSILFLVGAAMVSAQTQAPYTHPGKVQVRSTSSDALVVFGGGVFGVSTDPSSQQLDVRSAGDDLGGGIRISRADGSYFIMNMDDGGSTAWGTLQAGDGGAFRPIKLNPNGGQTLVHAGTVNAPGLAFSAYTGAGMYASAFGNLRFAVGGADALEMQAGGQINIPSRDNSSIGGTSILLGRNSNVTNAASGTVGIVNKAGTSYFLWVDNSAQLRIHTDVPSAFSGVSDTAGTVVGTQTSSRASKNILWQVNVYAPTAMDLIRKTPVWAFTYKNGAYNGETFYGITTDDSPLFGMDGGKSFNPVNAFGATVLALQDVDRRVQDLEARLAAALATIETLKKEAARR